MENFEKKKKRDFTKERTGNKISPEIPFFLSLPITRVETRTNDGENDGLKKKKKGNVIV